MQRFRSFAVFAVSILVLALIAWPSITSSQNERSSRPETPQRLRRSHTRFVKKSDKSRIPNRYIVVLNDDVVADDNPREARLERVTEIANSHALAHLGRVDYIYETALKGYAIELFDEAAAVAISRRPEVQWVEEDESLEPAQAPASPQPSPPWGLDVIDGSTFPLGTAPSATGRTTGIYQFNGTGTGVNAYVVDTGINTAHQDFSNGISSRAVQAADCIRNNDCRNGPPSGFVDLACAPGMPNTVNNDCWGHGTHVAAILGGNTYGVAKGVNIKSVKVCRTAPANQHPCPASALIAGVNWVTSEHTTNSAVPKVMNISLWGNRSIAVNPPLDDPPGVDAAVANAISNGVTVVVCAGNASDNALNYFPADVEPALTVGAVDWNGNRWIEPFTPEGSNYGPGVDLWAPGVFVVSAQTSTSTGGDCGVWNGSNTSECRASGTSMAAPHVAGAVAMYLQGRTGLSNCVFPINGPAPPLNANLSTCPDRIARYIKANASRDRLTNSIHVVTNPGPPPVTVFSPNLFLHNIAMPTLPNPLENQFFFVWTQYVDFLNREPDSGGFQNWVNVLNACPGLTWPCINDARIHVVRGFIESGEFRANKPELSNPPSTHAYNEAYARWLYRSLLHREPDAGGLANHVNNLDATGDYDHTVHDFINSVEYRVRFGPN
jgi:subtilisin family serine protease